MLSAIAARKAAQAAQPVVPHPTPTPPQEDSDSLSDVEILTTSRSPKRKGEPNAGREQKRRRKTKRTERKQDQQRYFTQPAIPSTPENDARSSSSEISDEDDVVEVEDVAAVTTKERAWSPSYPLDVLPPPTKPAWKPNFVPIVGSNVFRSHELPGGRHGCLLVMQEGETAALQGTYTLTVLRGTVVLMGAELHPSPLSHPVCAPRCSPVPVIECTNSVTNTASADMLPGNIGTGAVVLLEDLHTGVEGLGRVCKVFDGAFDIRQDEWTGLRTASLISLCTPGLHPFLLPPSWKEALSVLDTSETDAPKIFIRGPKNSGKSSLARSAVNFLLRFYNRVAFLECDVGQTEFTPPGIAALNTVEHPLFSPPFIHQSTPFAAHFIGSTSRKQSPSHYIQCIQALVETYRTELHVSVSNECDDDRISDTVPLVVNTMGWTKGLGADLARQIEEAVEPTHIFSFEYDAPSSQHSSFPADSPHVLKVSPIPIDAQTSRYSASDWRSLSMLSYFYSRPSDPESCLNAWDCSLPLVAQRPYSVQASKALDNVTLLGAGTEDVVSSEIGRVLNGAIVALVSSEEAEKGKVTENAIPYIQGAAAPDPFISRCLGLALIRGVAPDGETLQLLTPIPVFILASTPPRDLVKGEIELPKWGFLDHREGGLKIPDDALPYLAWSKGEGIGGERRRARRNLMRRSQQ